MVTEENFEGSLYRQVHTGMMYDQTGLHSSMNTVTNNNTGKPVPWYGLLKGGKFTIISGPARWTSGRIQEIESKEFTEGGKPKKGSWFIFDKPLAMPADKPVFTSDKDQVAGMIAENLERVKDGFMGSTSSFNAQGNCYVHPETRTGGFGYASACIDPKPPEAKPDGEGDDEEGKKKDAKDMKGGTMVFTMPYQHFMNNNGTWHFHCWMKAKDNGAKVKIGDKKMTGEQDISLTSDWKKYELTFKADKVEEAKNSNEKPGIKFTVIPVGGAILLDDVQIWKEGDKNPSPFCDQVVDGLKEMGVNSFRRVNMGGDTMENFLSPALKKYRYENSVFFPIGPKGKQTKDPYSLHDVLLLCEHLSMEPWWCLPGNLNLEEIDLFMEYLGGPETTKGGKMRHEMGHPQPWTESLRKIHVEIGNEAWNAMGRFLGGGFNGPDYWRDLFMRVKKSPYYKPNVLCHSAGQNYTSPMADAILGYTKGEDGVQYSDRYATGMYQVHGLDKAQLEVLNNDEKLLKFAFAYSMDGYLGKPFQKQIAVSKKYGVEYSMYEINMHVTGGDAPVEPRVKTNVSISAGINVLNTMLGCLKHGGIRTQNFFQLFQQYYSPMPPGPKNIPIWGSALSLRPDQKRYRPTGLALILTNKVLRGDLVETKHSSGEPTYTGTIIHGGKKAAKGGGGPEDLTFPVLHSYAFKDGTKRGLILFNFDLATPQEVELKFPGSAKNTQAWKMTAATPIANNEYETGEIQVKIDDEPMPALASGQKITLAPHSMMTIKWEE